MGSEQSGCLSARGEELRTKGRRARQKQQRGTREEQRKSTGSVADLRDARWTRYCSKGDRQEKGVVG